MTTNPTSAERSVESVAAGLTKAQREWVLDPARDSDVNQICAADPAWDQCCDLGLSDYWTDRLTPLGLAVRAHLTASEKKG
ncbi:hypothetical protein [Novosphingobium sp. HII-3]|uniref:hypothetical protein n=1 Tax=Novosphingobium sp. HII-3 TaxID=2075565 RepID=UPI000CDAF7FA|nr:hypothetical protein [Novosphingobium sp. HII-3]